MKSDAGISKSDLGSMMDQNWNLRRGMYGDEALGDVNLEMIECARSVGAAAKFCGSGGAVLVCCPGGEQQVAVLLGAWLMCLTYLQ
jgi:glucuronokinase